MSHSSKKKRKQKNQESIVQQPIQIREEHNEEIKKNKQTIINIEPRTDNQRKYIKAIEDNSIVFCSGPAGTGKSYLSIYMAVKYFLSGEVQKIILTRPAVEAGERFGFLPGDIKEKIDPYLHPAYDALYEMIGKSKTEKLIEDGKIEIAPIAFMRGVTFKKSFVVLDEAQNTTKMQMKMFLTRMGEESKMVVNGDITQTDIRSNESGLNHAIKLLSSIRGISHITMDSTDIQRHPIVMEIVKAYEKEENNG